MPLEELIDQDLRWPCTLLTSAELPVQTSHLLSLAIGQRMYLDVVHPVQQGDLMARGLYLASNALVLCKQCWVALHIRGRVGQLRDLQDAQGNSQDTT